MTEFNRTSEDGYRKFCLNIPLALNTKIDERRKELEFKHLCDYLLDLVETDIEHKLLQPPSRYYVKADSLRKNLFSRLTGQ